MKRHAPSGAPIVQAVEFEKCLCQQTLTFSAGACGLLAWPAGS